MNILTSFTQSRNTFRSWACHWNAFRCTTTTCGPAEDPGATVALHFPIENLATYHQQSKHTQAALARHRTFGCSDWLWIGAILLHTQCSTPKYRTLELPRVNCDVRYRDSQIWAQLILAAQTIQLFKSCCWRYSSGIRWFDSDALDCD